MSDIDFPSFSWILKLDYVIDPTFYLEETAWFLCRNNYIVCSFPLEIFIWLVKRWPRAIEIKTLVNEAHNYQPHSRSRIIFERHEQ